MRTYGKNYKAHPSTVTRMTAKDYANRESDEWDLRVDLNEDVGLTASKIVDNLKENMKYLQYVLVGGIEIPDTANLIPSTGFKTMSGTTSLERHVHVALVAKKAINRAQVLVMVRGIRKWSDEYATPRNKKYTYAGWVAHHTKQAYKEDADAPTTLFEAGDLPMDSYDETTCWNVVKMVRKFGNPDIVERFRSYSEKLDEIKLAKKLEAASKIESKLELTEDEIRMIIEARANKDVQM